MIDMERPQRECAACGMTGDCITSAAGVDLGYECGCVQAFVAAMTVGMSWDFAAEWARKRRKGKP